jgi:hypothetical protein
MKPEHHDAEVQEAYLFYPIFLHQARGARLAVLLMKAASGFRSALKALLNSATAITIGEGRVTRLPDGTPRTDQ